jgi:hypothetical protein
MLSWILDLQPSRLAVFPTRRDMSVNQVITAFPETKTQHSFVIEFGLLFVSETSDIDFIVDIASSDPFEYADNYFNLKFALEELLKRQIDLLENKTIKNPYLRENIDNSKSLLYAS